MNILILRLKDLFFDTSTTDALTKNRTHFIGTIAIAHIAISAWLSVGLATIMLPLFASLSAIVLWGLIWESYQFTKARIVGGSKTRLLRDWLLGDLPFYVIGASAQIIWEYIAFSFLSWSIMTIVLFVVVVIASIAFGRLLTE